MHVSRSKVNADWLSHDRGVNLRHLQAFVYIRVKISTIPEKSKVRLHFINKD